MVWGIGCGVSMIVFGYQKMNQKYFKNYNLKGKLISFSMFLWKRGIQRYIFHKYTLMAAGIITVFAILVSLGNLHF